MDKILIVKYKSDKKDDIDQYIGNYCNSVEISLPIERVSEGVYQIGPKKIHFMMKP